MPRQLHLEGPALEPLLAQARADHGAAVTVVGAHRVRRGGVAGFFTREQYEVTIEVPDPVAGETTLPATATATVTATATPMAAAPVPAPTAPGASTLADLLALADRADGGRALADVGTGTATAPVPVPVPVPPPGPTATEGGATSPGVGPQQAAPPVRLPGRALSTESRSFEEVLAALRADLLGPGSTDAVDRPRGSSVDPAGWYDLAEADPTAAEGRAATTSGVPAQGSLAAAPPRPAATPWQPLTVIEDPAVPTDLDLTGLPTTVAPLGVRATTVTPMTVTPVAVAPVAVAPVVVLGARNAAATTEAPADLLAVPSTAGTAGTAGTGDTGDTGETGETAGTDDTAQTGDTDTVAPVAAPVGAGTVPVLTDPLPVPETAVPAPAGTVPAYGETVAAGHVDALPAPQATAGLLEDLVARAVEVGADRHTARDAALEVEASGVRTLHHALPLLAAALADRVVRGPGAGQGPHGTQGTDPAPAVPAGPGDVVVVLGAPGRVDVVAADVATQLGTSVVARWSDDLPGRHLPGVWSGEVLREALAVPGLAGRARALELPAVLAVADPSLAEGVPPALAGQGRAALLRALAADVVVLVVDADTSRRRQDAVVPRVAAAHGDRRALVLALVGCDGASAPLAHSARPVALLDGRRATAGTWTGVVLDALRGGAR